MHIKRVELSHFKSFGGTAQVPLLPGFTVISGPNGSGKSNILDALLFGLGLASSKGMRADRLPDLVNQSQMSRRSTSEASVTVTFDIGDVPPELMAPEAEDEVPTSLNGHGNGSQSANGNGHQPGATNTNGHGSNGQGQNGDEIDSSGNGANIVPLPVSGREWSVTRRLRVTNQGTYTSTYFINGEPCTLGQLHEQLQRFHIYPEGYNVVLQGDVTGIISMNGKERREIIDELAGVAAFDRKIDQAKGKLDAVREHEERFHIVERELQAQLEKLSQERQKAEKYQKLKATYQDKSQWESVLVWQGQQQQIANLQQTIERGQAETVQLNQTIGPGRGGAENSGGRTEHPQRSHQSHGGRRASGPAVPGGYQRRPNYGNSSDPPAGSPLMGTNQRQAKKRDTEIAPARAAADPGRAHSAPSSSAPAA